MTMPMSQTRLDEGLSLRFQPVRNLVADKIGEFKIFFAIHRNGDVLGRAGLWQNDFTRLDAGIFQINPQLPGGGFEGWMPLSNVKRFDAAQDAVGILVGGNVAERERVGGEQIGRS